MWGVHDFTLIFIYTLPHLLVVGLCGLMTGLFVCISLTALSQTYFIVYNNVLLFVGINIAFLALDMEQYFNRFSKYSVLPIALTLGIHCEYYRGCLFSIYALTSFYIQDSIRTRICEKHSNIN